MYKPAMIAGAFLGLLAVILGAFAAHGLTQVLPPDKIEIFQKGVTYQFYHCFALLVAGMAYAYFPYRGVRSSVIFFILGVVFFSGSLYVYPLLEVNNVSIPVAARLITPLGGICFIIGWLLLLASFMRKASRPL